MALFDCISCKDLLTINIDNTPTFINMRRREALDITICNRSAIGLDGQVCLEHFLSNHMYIDFKVNTA